MKIYLLTLFFGRSTQGGTRLTIYGYNFAQNGLFSTQTVLIGNAPCKVIDYYTTDGQIVCTTPPCMDPVCLADPNSIGEYSINSNLAVYVTNVMSIVGTSSTFTYSTAYTPAIFQMSRYSWGTGTAYVTGYITAAYLDDVSISVGTNNANSNFAYIGEPGELNQELWGNSNYKWYTSSNSIYYRSEFTLLVLKYGIMIISFA